jgi:ABC-type branched-subunit amino acid transport system ATPase component
MRPLLVLEEVTVRYGGITALSGVSLSVDAGIICGVIGPNGSGKTTALGVISGLVKPSAGRCILAGQDYTGQDRFVPARLGIARTFQAVRLLGNLDVRHNVMVGADTRRAGRSILGDWLNVRRCGREEEASRAVADAALSRVGMLNYAKSHPYNLSYGMQRRVEIARALASEPKLLLLDEPTAGMSQSERRDIATIMDDLRREGLTQILVEHDLGMVHKVCEAAYVLNFGEVIASGTPGRVAAQKQVREAYLGRSAELPKGV